MEKNGVTIMINLLESLTTSPPSEGETAEETAQRIALANQATNGFNQITG